MHVISQFAIRRWATATSTVVRLTSQNDSQFWRGAPHRARLAASGVRCSDEFVGDPMLFEQLRPQCEGV